MNAKTQGYQITLLFFWLRTVNLAIKRVEPRVIEGGHNIPEDIIKRRYENVSRNFFNIFESIVDEWLFIDNSGEPYEIIARKNSSGIKLENASRWKELQDKYKLSEHGQ